MEESARDQERSRKWRRSSSHPPVSGGRRPALGRADTEDGSRSRSRGAVDQSRSSYQAWPPRTASTLRRRSVSRAPYMSAVHREAHEHRFLGRVSRVSAKKGRLSDLLYDTGQEAALEKQQEEDQREVRRIEDSSDDDDGCHDLQAALDDQALDLDINYDDYALLNESE